MEEAHSLKYALKKTDKQQQNKIKYTSAVENSATPAPLAEQTGRGGKSDECKILLIFFNGSGKGRGGGEPTLTLTPRTRGAKLYLRKRRREKNYKLY